MTKETGKHYTKWKIEKFLNDEDHKNNMPYEVAEFDGNVLLDEGINEMLLLIIGDAAPTPYNNSNAQLGVGNSSTAAASTQTDLQGGSTAWKAMDDGYPTVSGNVLTFKSTFGSTDANFAWEEFSVRNGSSRNKNLNRKVESKGTKASGETWVLTLTIELS